jgi:hypothetical protein
MAMASTESYSTRGITTASKLILWLILAGMFIVETTVAQDRPATPAGLVVFDRVGDTPLSSGELFLAVGPNNVADANIDYRLFYALSANEPAGPLDGTEYQFGTSPGDGGGVAAFGFVLGGLEPGRSYTFWLFQRDTSTGLHSNPAIVRALAVGVGEEPTRPATPAGLISSTTVGGNPVANGELFLAVGPNDVASANIRYRLFYALATEQPRGPLAGTEYVFGSTPGDGGGVSAFGFVLRGLERGREYTFWLYQHNTATDLHSNPLILVASAAGEASGPDDPGRILAPADVNDLQKFPIVFNVDAGVVDWDGYTLFPFEGAALWRVENPDKSTGNPTDYVVRYLKQPAAQPWGGFFYHLQDTVRTTANSVFRLNVWSPRAGIRGLMKLESRAGATTGDLFADITVANQWTTVEWNLSGANRNIDWDMVTIIMDLDTSNPPQGGARDTWYLDDFELVGMVSTSTDEIAGLPTVYQLHQNYPNPFNPATTVRFELPRASHVTLEVYNMIGQRVSVLANGTYQPGAHAVLFDAADLPSGTYFYRIQAGSFSQTQTMTLVK